MKIEKIIPPLSRLTGVTCYCSDIFVGNERRLRQPDVFCFHFDVGNIFININKDNAPETIATDYTLNRSFGRGIDARAIWPWLNSIIGTSFWGCYDVTTSMDELIALQFEFISQSQAKLLQTIQLRVIDSELILYQLTPAINSKLESTAISDKVEAKSYRKKQKEYVVLVTKDKETTCLAAYSGDITMMTRETSPMLIQNSEVNNLEFFGSALLKSLTRSNNSKQKNVSFANTNERNVLQRTLHACMAVLTDSQISIYPLEPWNDISWVISSQSSIQRETLAIKDTKKCIGRALTNILEA